MGNSSNKAPQECCLARANTGGGCAGRATNMTGAITLGMLASDAHLGSPKSSKGQEDVSHYNWGDVVRSRLYAAGMDTCFVEEKTGLFAKAANRLLEMGKDPGMKATAFWVPGRIEVGGKGCDFAGGRSLMAAVNKGFAVLSVDREDDICNIYTTTGNPSQETHIAMNISENCYGQSGHWSEYAATTIQRMVKNFGIKKGVDIVVEYDLPELGGLGVSSAVVCFMWNVLSERNDIRSMPAFKDKLATTEDVYAYLGCIENGQSFRPRTWHVSLGDTGPGTFGGSQDHPAIMACEAGQLRMYSYCPITLEATFAFPDSLTFVIAITGEPTSSAKEDNNNPDLLARDAAAAWCDVSPAELTKINGFVPGRANLAEIVHYVREKLNAEGTPHSELDQKVRRTIGDTIAQLDDGATYGPSGKGSWSWSCYTKGRLRERFEQFFDESEIFAPHLAESLAACDYEAIASWSVDSHRESLDCLRNATPETTWLPQEARALKAIGASAVGPGFAGSCWAIVEKNKAAEFAATWKYSYTQKFPDRAATCQFFVSQPSTGALTIR